MIVDCESCGTRFNLADGQVPPQGARVRCSKCHHRFHVLPPAAGEKVATTQPPKEPEPSAAPDDPDLDNPEFLFDSPAAKGPQDQGSLGLTSPADRFSLGSEERDRGGESPAPPPADPTPPASQPDLGEQGVVREQVFGLDPGEHLGEPTPEPPSGEPPSTDPAALFDSGLREEPVESDEEPSVALASVGEWDTDAATPELDAPLGSLLEPPPRTVEPVRRASISRAPGVEPSEDPHLAPDLGSLASRAANTFVRTTAIAVGLLLVLGGARLLRSHGMGTAAGPDVIRAAGWTATEIAARHLEDDLGRTVLVVQGQLIPERPGPPPRLQTTLLDARGGEIEARSLTILRRLAAAELAPAALGALLSGVAADEAAPEPTREGRGEVVEASTEHPGGDARAAPAGGPVSGFTVLIPEPPASARRFRLDLLPSEGRSF